MHAIRWQSRHHGEQEAGRKIDESREYSLCAGSSVTAARGYQQQQLHMLLGGILIRRPTNFAGRSVPA